MYFFTFELQSKEIKFYFRLHVASLRSLKHLIREVKDAMFVA